jgi:glycosyltransferase involved in cell wall biosynthesis
VNEYPKVLFVTSGGFNHLTGVGVTYSNLFAGWPKDRLATAHNDLVPTSNDVCDNYYVMGRSEIDLLGPMRAVRAFRDRGTGSQSLNATGGAAPTGIRKVIAQIQGNSAPYRARLTPRLKRWIATYRPDLLYTTLGSNAFMELSALIRRRFGIPTVVHMLDDLPSISYRNGVFASLERARMRRLIAETMSTAELCMGICQEMCDAFALRYGRPFVPFQNCVDIARWQPITRTESAASGSPFRVLYFGSVFHNAQLSALIEVCRSVARLNTDGIPVRFDIVSPSFFVAAHRASLELHPAVRVTEPTQDDQEYFSTLAAADALVIPVNFDAESVSYIRYSMPTKVPAYLASGTPILVYGPRGVAQVDYAAREGWGHVVSEQDVAAVDRGLRRILTDQGLRESLHRRAQVVASANHDMTQVREGFQDALKAAAGNGGVPARGERTSPPTRNTRVNGTLCGHAKSHGRS